MIAVPQDLDRSKLAAGAAVVAVAALGLGILAGVVQDVPPVFAAVCQVANVGCTWPDVTKTSAMEVDHKTTAAYEGGSIWVEPDDGETWEITATWATAPPPECFQTSETAYATVSWNGSAWVLSSVTTTTNIVGISICQGDECDAGGASTHSWQYKLIVSIKDPVGTITLYHLRDVRYQTTSVDTGYTIASASGPDDCDLDAAVSPTSQTNTAYDDPATTWNAARCTFACTVSGGSITIFYD